MKAWHYGLMSRTNLLFDSSVDTRQITLAHKAERSHLLSQSHHVLLKESNQNFLLKEKTSYQSKKMEDRKAAYFFTASF